jgi:predicted CopG family antitoxin
MVNPVGRKPIIVTDEVYKGLTDLKHGKDTSYNEIIEGLIQYWHKSEEDKKIQSMPELKIFENICTIGRLNPFYQWWQIMYNRKD